jgi:hypothetical protein
MFVLRGDIGSDSNVSLVTGIGQEVFSCDLSGSITKVFVHLFCLHECA